MRCAVCLLLVLVIFVPAQDRDRMAAELRALQGTWDVLKLEVAGESLPKGKMPKQITITDDKLRGIGPEMSMTLDPSKDPKWLDLTYGKNDKTITVRAIYELENGQLRICMPLVERGKEFEDKRPTRFATKGKAIALFTAKRG